MNNATYARIMENLRNRTKYMPQKIVDNDLVAIRKCKVS